MRTSWIWRWRTRRPRFSPLTTTNKRRPRRLRLPSARPWPPTLLSRRCLGECLRRRESIPRCCHCCISIGLMYYNFCFCHSRRHPPPPLASTSAPVVHPRAIRHSEGEDSSCTISSSSPAAAAAYNTQQQQQHSVVTLKGSGTRGSSSGVGGSSIQTAI